METKRGDVPDGKGTVKISKFLSLVLRHQPDTVGIVLDEGGWVDVDELIAACAARGRRFSRADLDHVVANNNKKRFAYSEDGRRIRASQGHSVTVDLGLAATTPPEVLYHGTASTTLPLILREGLRPMSRQDVHLSADVETAVRVGSRHGRPVVLVVDAARLAAEGHEFRVSANGVWLTGAVPPERLRQLPR
jgi:putative RNA 2'-phosphotransferase